MEEGSKGKSSLKRSKSYIILKIILEGFFRGEILYTDNYYVEQFQESGYHLTDVRIFVVVQYFLVVVRAIRRAL